MLGALRHLPYKKTLEFNYTDKRNFKTWKKKYQSRGYIVMTKPKRIFIVGHMGAGKALFGEALAKKLGWQYIDANPILERYIGRSLNEIFGKQVRKHFIDVK